MNYSDLHKAPSQSSEQGVPELLPCPWCGRVPLCYRIFEGDPEAYIVECRNELCPRRKAMAETSDPREVIQAWNTRTRSDICAALVEALEAIANHPYCSYDNSSVEVADGHRCAAAIARTALSQVKRDDK